MFSYWVSDLMNSPYKSSLDLMLTRSLVVGAFYFWAQVPQAILEVDPTAVPNKAAMLKETLIDSPNLLRCPEDLTLTKNILKEYHELIGDPNIEDPRAEVRKRAFAYTLTSILIGLMLNSVCTSHLHIGHIEKEEQWSNLTANRLLPCYVRNLLSLKETDLPKSLVTSPFSCGKRNLNIKPESLERN